MAAANPAPSVTAGKIRWENPSRPDTGKRPRPIEKKRINKGPNTKLGSDTPNKLAKLITLSAIQPRRSALMTPNGTETITEKIIDATASSIVAGYRSNMTEVTVS